MGKFDSVIASVERTAARPHYALGYFSGEDGEGATDGYRVHWEGGLCHPTMDRVRASFTPWQGADWVLGRGFFREFCRTMKESGVARPGVRIHKGKLIFHTDSGMTVAGMWGGPALDITGKYALDAWMLRDALGFLLFNRKRPVSVDAMWGEAGGVSMLRMQSEGRNVLLASRLEPPERGE